MMIIGLRCYRKQSNKENSFEGFCYRENKKILENRFETSIVIS